MIVKSLSTLVVSILNFTLYFAAEMSASSDHLSLFETDQIMAVTKSELNYLDVWGAQRSGIQVRIRSCFEEGVS
jgi:hypothetical protein